MDRWEYMGDTVPKPRAFARLNELGAEGWELVNYEVLAYRNDDETELTFLMKRKVD